jgi:serine/threonine-protein kinase 24/25/MST4
VVVGSNTGNVYRARDKAKGEIVAVKRIMLDTDDSNQLKKILLEIKNLKDCESPYITSFHGSYLKGQHLSIVMELCGLGSLKRLMTKLRSPLAEREIAAVLHQVLKALIYLHNSKLIHRDIKAEYATHPIAFFFFRCTYPPPPQRLFRYSSPSIQ